MQKWLRIAKESPQRGPGLILLTLRNGTAAAATRLVTIFAYALRIA